MACFADRTFCNDPDCQGVCGFEPWTPELQAAADKWWRWFCYPGEPKKPAPVSFLIHERRGEGST